MIRTHDRNRPPPPATTLFADEQTPGWTLGLRNLYWAAADEPIPADFAELLARLERRSAS